MSAELSLTLRAAFSKNGLTISKSFAPVVDVSGNYAIEARQNVGTSDETLALGDVGSTPGYIILTNRDATNYILIGADGSSYPIKLKPGESAILRFNGSAIHAKANTAACDLEYVVLPD